MNILFFCINFIVLYMSFYCYSMQEQNKDVYFVGKLHLLAMYNATLHNDKDSQEGYLNLCCAGINNVSDFVSNQLKLKQRLIHNLPLKPIEILKKINFSSNNIKMLPQEIGELISLQSLNVAYNNLTKIPDEINKLTRLQLLDISYNKLSQFPGNIYRPILEINDEGNPFNTFKNEVLRIKYE